MPALYYLGIDGGTTKTRAVIGDDSGHVLGTGESGPCNHQIVGLETTMSNLAIATRQALTTANLSLAQIGRAVFGLSGMDLPMHREVLEAALKKTFPGLVFDLVNDTWVMLSAGTAKGWGIAVVCGGGANACARSPDGAWVTLRGLGYESGLRGGGLDMLRDVLHYAFLSRDGTGPQTLLEQPVLEVTSAPDYDTLQLLLLEALQDPAHHGGLLQRALDLVPLVFDGATAGDDVCKHILMLQAEYLAEGITGLVRRMHFEREQVEVVLGGAIFEGSNPLLIDRLTLVVHERAPKASLHRPLLDPPALGAYSMALEAAGRPVGEELYSLLARQTI